MVGCIWLKLECSINGLPVHLSFCFEPVRPVKQMPSLLAILVNGKQKELSSGPVSMPSVLVKVNVCADRSLLNAVTGRAQDVDAH